MLAIALIHKTRDESTLTIIPAEDAAQYINDYAEEGYKVLSIHIQPPTPPPLPHLLHPPLPQENDDVQHHVPD